MSCIRSQWRMYTLPILDMRDPPPIQIQFHFQCSFRKFWQKSYVEPPSPESWRFAHPGEILETPLEAVSIICRKKMPIVTGSFMLTEHHSSAVKAETSASPRYKYMIPFTEAVVALDGLLEALYMTRHQSTLGTAYNVSTRCKRILFFMFRK